mgnify:CR=1 FL=1
MLNKDLIDLTRFKIDNSEHMEELVANGTAPNIKSAKKKVERLDQICCYECRLQRIYIK